MAQLSARFETKVLTYPTGWKRKCPDQKCRESGLNGTFFHVKKKHFQVVL